MNSDHVRNLIAQQRAIEASKPPVTDGKPTLGDIAAGIVTVPVIAWAIIDCIVRLLP